MNLRLIRQSAIFALTALNLGSCAATRFYATVDGRGVIHGRPSIDWVKPDKFVYDRGKNPAFFFRRPNGEIIRPGDIETDGGSIPRLLWFQDGYSPWTFAPAYLIHDWMYEAHRRRMPAGVSPDGRPLYYTREQADWIMAEVIKTQMERPLEFETRKSPGQLRKIYWAVSKFGDEAWNGQAHLVQPSIASTLINETWDNMPLSPALDSVKAQLTPVPRKPEQRGAATPQP